MHIQFSQSRPQSARLVAQVTDKGKLPEGLEKALAEGAESARFKGKAGQLFEGFVERDGQVLRLALAGAGDRNDETRLANCEKAGAALAAKYQSIGNAELVLDLAGSSLSAEEAASVLLGLRLRNWRYDIYRTTMKDEQKVTLATVTAVGAPEGTEAAWDELTHLAAGVEFTRELITEPANILYPESFVERCRERFAGTGAEIIVLDEAEMEKLGMGSLLGVGLGSDRESRILAIRWDGGEAGAAPTAFVGKGVTFDTGGISIKPGPGMEDMKWDMGGAGAVAGAMLALAGRKAKANIVGVMGLVENMPDGKAQRPGDVVTSMSGQTIEVLNTDAEGRFVFDTVKPGAVPDPGNALQAPHINVTIFARGMDVHLFTRLYFTDEKEANAIDPVLNSVAQTRRPTLLATRSEDGGRITYAFEITMHGENETVFFDA